MRALRRVCPALLAGLLFFTANGSAGAQTVPGCAPPAPGGDWPFYSGTLDGHREQLAETTITKENVGQLALAWKLPMPDGANIQSTPTVVGGCVFTGTASGTVLAANADTGEVVWTQELATGDVGSAFEGAGLVGAPAVANGLVYAPLTTEAGGVLVALDQATGAVVWTRVIDDDAGAGLDSSPVPFDGMIFQAFKGDESSDHSNPGWAILDGSRKRGGRVLVKTHMIPAADYAAGYRGGSMIDTPTIDPERKLLFAGTGNPASPKQHPLTNSLIKVDLDRRSPTFGQVLDSQRGTSDSYPAPQDVDTPNCEETTTLQWPVGRISCAQLDYNFLASPNLFTHSDGRQLFGQLQKSGVYMTVDTATMEPVWRATVGVPCLGCNLASTAADADGLYVTTTGGNLYALNRDTGAVKWATPLTGTTRFNGLTIANGIVFSVNDLGALQAFDTATGQPLLTHPLAPETGTITHDAGNSSGLSIARGTAFFSSQAGEGSTLFAFRLPR